MKTNLRQFILILAFAVAACNKGMQNRSDSGEVTFATPVASAPIPALADSSGSASLPAPSADLGGDWNSGGGYAPNNQFNPWFVRNTKSVRYCVEIDQTNFGLDLKTARKGIVEAIDFWKREFERSRKMMHSHASEEDSRDLVAFLGTQTFLESPCDDKTDIRIQLGFLSDAQKAKTPKPKNFLAFTVRTDYDPVNLKGKGFIYVSPAQGPLAPSDIPLGEKRWSYSDALNFRIMIAHEFGHVFGASNSKHILMAPNIMSYVRTVKAEDPKSQVPFVKLTDFLDSDLWPYEIRQICVDEGVPSVELPGNISARCRRMSLESVNANRYQVHLSYSQDGKTWLPYGEFTGSRGQTSINYFGQVIYDEQQNVFPTLKGSGAIDTQSSMAHRNIQGTLTVAFEPKPLATTLDLAPHDAQFTVHAWMDKPEWAHHTSLLRFFSESRTYKSETGF